jgi:membrane protein DedA with SNARE-associated domain
MMFPLATILSWVQAEMDFAGYPVLFGLLLSCGLGVPLPEDIPLLLAGYFVADGKMNLVLAAISAWCGIIGGDCILYGLGRKFGPNIVKVPVIGTHISPERMKWAHERFEKYGFWVVAVGRLFAGIRGAMVITAGTIKFTFSHFVLADGIAAIFSGGLFMALGYWGRKKFGDIEQIRARVESSQRIVLVGVVTAVVLFALWQWYQNRKKQKRKQEIIQHAKLREAASHHE